MASFLPHLVDPTQLESYGYSDVSKSVNCFHLNLRSGRNKYEEIECFFSDVRFPFHVLMFTETWFRSDAEAFHFPEYNCHCLNRESKRGGGVCILTLKEINCEILSGFTCVTPNYEVITLKCDTCVYCVCYRPPGHNISDFLSFLDALLQFVDEFKWSVIIGGDMNIDFSADSAMKFDFETLLNTHSCHNVITAPTRITENTATILDLFITNYNRSHIKAGVINYGISDHLPIYISVSRTNTIKQKHSYVYREINPVTLSKFRDCLSNVDWYDVFNENDPDAAYDKFLCKFTRMYDDCFPYKTSTKSRKGRKPWMNHELLSQIRKREQLYRAFVQKRSAEALKTYKSFRNCVNKNIRLAKKEYYTNLFCSSQGRSEQLWKKLKSVIGHVPEPLTKLVKDGIELKGTELSNAFNNFFVSFTPLCKDNHNPEIKYYNQHTIFLDPVSESEIVSSFIKLNNSKSVDASGIQITPVKYVIDIIANCLVHIFNICLTTGVFPRKMQRAKVAVIYKKGDKNIFSNYRPISILPVFSKGLEKVILTRLTSFVERYKILNPAQYGFQRRKSTELALLAQKEYILENFENHNLVLGVFLDFTKAFDCLSHHILLQKLHYYGIRGNAHSLVSSYLRHRSQYVEINGYSSSLREVKLGVPQGSILGPFLFLLYINDIVTIDETVKYVIYADDTSIFFSGRSAIDLANRANITLDLIQKWSFQNHLELNVDKTKALLFHPRQKESSTYPLFINGTSVEYVQSFKTLGIYFSANMTWDAHVDFLVGKLSRTIGFLQRNCAAFPVAVNILLYNSLFASTLNYGALVWATTTNTNIVKLFLLQKRIIRLSNKMPYLSHTADLFAKLRIVKVPSIYEYRLCRYYKLCEKNQDIALQNIANLRINLFAYHTRNPEHWEVTRIRTNYGKQMLKYQLPSLLNNLQQKHRADITCVSLEDVRGMFV